MYRLCRPAGNIPLRRLEPVCPITLWPSWLVWRMATQHLSWEGRTARQLNKTTEHPNLMRTKPHEKPIEIGTMFNRWKVVSLGKIDRKTWQRKYICICNCGKSKPRPILSAHLRYGNSKSCGCLQRENHRLATEKKDTALRNLFDVYKRHAKRRGLSWGLSIEQFREITSSNCYYTGRLPSSVSTAGFGNYYTYNGIDRKDNSVGYVWDNCVPCCKDANWAKQKMSMKEFLSFIDEIRRHFKE